jgi:hypothetical protein
MIMDRTIIAAQPGTANANGNAIFQDRMHSMPTVCISDEERGKGALDAATTLEAFQLFNANGCLLIKNLFSRRYVEQMHDEYLSSYAAYLLNDDLPDALDVAEMRKLVTLELKGSFNSSDLYANPLLTPLLADCLGQNMVLNSVGVVHSLPGAPDQHVHRDYPSLYHTGEHWKLQRFIPPHAITVAIPLVPLNAGTGSTRMWRGSHYEKMDDFADHPFVDPIAELGDCLLMDYRLLHGGRSNQSQRVRPVIYNVYSRAWFRDDVNYLKQRPLVISDEEFAKVPEQHRYLFRRLNNGF